MLYPLLSEYIDAILSPEDSFEELRDLHPVLDDAGRPVMSSGNFAVVFKMEDASKKLYALKCFLREQDGRDSSYKLIAQQLNKVDSPYFLKIRYLENEIFVDTSTSGQTEFPVLVMDWVEGKTLDKYIREKIDSSYYLAALAYEFSLLANWLAEQPFAHGDLKPDNIIVQDDGQIVLIDYDGMFVPGMEGQEARELGSPDFRHPGRNSKMFDARIDDFPVASILLSLKLISIKPELLEQYGTKEGLLFSENDYRNPDSCPLLVQVLPEFSDEEVLHIKSIFKIALKYGKLERSIPMLLAPVIDGVYAGFFEEGEWLSGVKYSKDRLRLLKVNPELENCNILEGTVCICGAAFESCEKIKTVQLPKSVARICYAAFKYCYEIEEICIPPRVQKIESETFRHCDKLSNVYIRSKVLSEIEEMAFFACSSLTCIDIPDSVKIIGDNAFQDCWNLTTVRLPASLESIGDYAFFGCTSLRQIYIPDNVKNIGSYAFGNCKSLSSIRLPNNIKTIGSGILSHCDSFRKIYGENIPDGTSDVVINGNHIAVGDKTEIRIPRCGFGGRLGLDNIIRVADL